MNKYEDIINLPHHVSKTSNRMSLEDRSAIFAPFQALEGFSSDIYETERLTSKRIILDESKKEILNQKILYLYNNKLEGTFTYFIKDKKKDGGCYKKITSIIKKIDYINQELVFYSMKLNINDLIDIE